MSADDKKDIEENADIDGPLVDYKSKGNKVELLGKDKLEGTDAYKLKATLKNGDVMTIYLDADSFLEIKEEVKRHGPRHRTAKWRRLIGRLQGSERCDVPLRHGKRLSKAASKRKSSRSPRSSSTSRWTMPSSRCRRRLRPPPKPEEPKK